jgi:hypothetical protein
MRCLQISMLLASAFSLALAETTSHTDTTLITSATPSPTSTSIIQATRIETDYPSAASATHLVDSAGGASGSDSSSFSLSQGGLIAIIIVVVAVAVFGIASIVLYVLAKRRQWNVRASLKRASRRLTGRSARSKPSDDAAKKKRSGIVAPNATPRPDANPTRSSSNNKQSVVTEVKDVERGPLDYGTPPKTKKPRENTWVSRLWGNDWK